MPTETFKDVEAIVQTRKRQVGLLGIRSTTPVARFGVHKIASIGAVSDHLMLFLKGGGRGLDSTLLFGNFLFQIMVMNRGIAECILNRLTGYTQRLS